MFIDIESNRTPSLTDSLRDVMDKIKLIDAILIKYVFIFSVLVRIFLKLFVFNLIQTFVYFFLYF